MFDKVLLLYEGRQIFFGSTSEAQLYFEELGFVCPHRQTTPDFLTSMTSPSERVVRAGYENRAPRTPDEFANAWKASEHRRALLQEVSNYETSYSFDGEQARAFSQSRRAQQAKSQRVRSPYTLSYLQQVLLCLWRGFKLLKGDPSVTLTMLIGNFIQFLVIGSVFYNLPQDTNSLFRRGVLIFMGIALNAFASILEILTLYAKRPIVEKHNRYALYHPSAEAIAAMLTDLPYKIVNCILVNVTVYFMANLNRAAGPFFFYLFVSFLLTLTMVSLLCFPHCILPSPAAYNKSDRPKIVDVVPFHGLRNQDYRTSPGSYDHSPAGHHPVHGLLNPNSAHARLVTLDQLRQPSGLRFREPPSQRPPRPQLYLLGTGA